MEQAEHPETPSPGALKALRQRRKELVQAATARMRAQKKIIVGIKSHLARGPGTIPEISAATGNPPAEILWYVAALKKYGQVVEDQKDGDFYRYALSEASGENHDTC
jgi:hypothetical protein